MPQLPKVKPTKNQPIAGDRYGKLRIIQRVHDKRTKTANLKVQVRVECDCGNRLTIPFYYLVRTHYTPKTSCGKCGPKSFVALHWYTHRSWYMMNYRCEIPTFRQFAEYGGRGISVDPRWSWNREDNLGFENFVADMGDRPQNHSIDRYPDNDGHYTPSNCRWATAQQQRNNQGRSGTTSPLPWLVPPEDADPDIPQPQNLDEVT